MFILQYKTHPQPPPPPGGATEPVPGDQDEEIMNAELVP